MTDRLISFAHHVLCWPGCCLCRRCSRTPCRHHTVEQRQRAVAGSATPTGDDTLRAIATDLAAQDPHEEHGVYTEFCRFCSYEDHDAGCPWLRARAVAGSATPTTEDT